MTRLSRTGFAIHWLAVFAVIAGLLTLGNVPTIAAGPATPPGTIYYTIYSNGTLTYYAVKADGSGLTSNVIPSNVNVGHAVPAFRPSGSNATQDRWWIFVEQTGVYPTWVQADGTIAYNLSHFDIFAGRTNPQNRSQFQTVQLTDLYGVVRLPPAIPVWSNDSNDNANSYVMAGAQDIRDPSAYDPDTGTFYFNQMVRCNLRAPITAPEIQAGWQANDYVPISDTSTTPEELDSMLWPWIGYPYMGEIAPDGNSYLLMNGSTQLQIADWANPGNPPQMLWNGSSGVPNVMSGATWSPNGATVALVDAYGNGNNGNIWTIAAGGGTPKKVLATSVKGTTTIKYTNPIWSPDSKYLVVLKQQFSGTSLTGAWLTRLSLSDGKTLDLVPVSTSNSPMYNFYVNTPIRWVADN